MVGWVFLYLKDVGGPCLSLGQPPFFAPRAPARTDTCPTKADHGDRFFGAHCLDDSTSTAASATPKPAVVSPGARLLFTWPPGAGSLPPPAGAAFLLGVSFTLA